MEVDLVVDKYVQNFEHVDQGLIFRSVNEKQLFLLDEYLSSIEDNDKDLKEADVMEN
jgi:hypothetical protein